MKAIISNQCCRNTSREMIVTNFQLGIAYITKRRATIHTLHTLPARVPIIKIPHLRDNAGKPAGDGAACEGVAGDGEAEALVGEDPDGGIEEVAEDGRREAAVKADEAMVPAYLQRHPRGAAGVGGRGGGRAEELEASLGGVDREGRRLGRHGR